jgi:REP element-mobilizing transposase RayT
MSWGRKYWTSGYYVNTVGKYRTEEAIRKYFENRGREKESQKIYGNQLRLF